MQRPRRISPPNGKRQSAPSSDQPAGIQFTGGLTIKEVVYASIIFTSDIGNLCGHLAPVGPCTSGGLARVGRGPLRSCRVELATGTCLCAVCKPRCRCAPLLCHTIDLL